MYKHNKIKGKPPNYSWFQFLRFLTVLVIILLILHFGILDIQDIAVLMAAAKFCEFIAKFPTEDNGGSSVLE